MANSIKGEVPLKLDDGREFVLVLDHEALIQAGAAHGKGIKGLFRDMQPSVDDKGNPLLDGDGEIITNPNMEAATRALLYGALLAKHPTITLRDASSVLFADPDKVGAALEEAGAASGLLAGQNGEDRKVPNPSKRTGRGKSSGRSGAKRG